MRYTKRLAVAGAAVLISVGSAHAGQEPRGARGDERTGPERQQTSWGVTPGEPAGPARATTDAGPGADGSAAVTRDELDRRTDEIIRRVERAQAAPAPAPMFGDEG